MIIPRFSIRWIMGLIAVSALFFLVFSLAVRGDEWAAAVVAPGLAMLLLIGLFLISFCGAYILGATVQTATGRDQAGTTPFAGQPFAVAEAVQNGTEITVDTSGTADALEAAPPNETRTETGDSAS